MAENQSHDNDRLSLLPETILIDILTRLPLKTAVSTEVLSLHWRGLWTEITSINIKILKFTPQLNTLDCIMRKLTSPSIHTFNLEDRNLFDYIAIGSSLRQICKRPLCHFRHSVSYLYETPLIPSFLFQTHSLVSIDLDSPTGWCFPVKIDLITLPNLVTLTLSVAASKDHKSLEKLIEGCPSLEKLSLKIGRWANNLISVKLSNVNLRWLYISFCTTVNRRLLINAPLLRYLAICGPLPPTLCFDEVPIGLYEAKIHFYYRSSDDKIDLMSKIYDTISNVTILNISYHVSTPVTVFQNVTCLIFTVEFNCDPFTILSKLVHFPKLNILILKVGGKLYSDKGRSSLEDAGVSALRQLKRIDIAGDSDFLYNVVMADKVLLSKLVAHLLRNATVLERFNLKTQTSLLGIREGDPIVEESEYMWCRILYDSPRASKECEVSLTGTCLLMSPKTVPKVLKANGEVLSLNTKLSHWDRWV